MQLDNEQRQYQKELFYELLLLVRNSALTDIGKTDLLITENAKDLPVETSIRKLDMLRLLERRFSEQLTEYEQLTLENIIVELELLLNC